MPNVDKTAFAAETRAFEVMNLTEKKQAIQIEDQNDWTCGVCHGSNPSITHLCTVCGRKKGRSLDTKNVQSKFKERMLQSMNDGQLMEFDGREEKEQARKRRNERIKERQILVRDIFKYFLHFSMIFSTVPYRYFSD